ncbi:MAG: Lar family restriction alleviation protein [Prolixibacteraceae bacterium]|nr:Lar family restriction alleviation protein [Prolixibacteraceae bacterium]
MKNKTVKLKDAEISLLPCPFCGSTDLSFSYDTTYGQGDRRFNHARIVCNNCTGAKGDGYGYGEPNDYDTMSLRRSWNQRTAR